VTIANATSKNLDENARNSNWIPLVVFYTVMHGGILLIPNAIYWDDWVLYRSSPETILDTFRQAGAIVGWTGYLHLGLLHLGPWSYKILTFILMLASGLLLDVILNRNGVLGRESRFLVVLLFLVLPFNLARVALIDFPYTLCHFLFFLAWYAIDRHRIAALLLFFLSFNTNSLLVFYSLPILDLMYRHGHFRTLREMLLFLPAKVDFIVLPFLYFAIKSIYFVPYGFYEGYRQGFNVNYIYPAMLGQFREVATIRINPGLLLLLVPMVFLFVKRKGEIIRKLENVAPVSKLYLLLLGMLAFFLAGLPYWVLGYEPTFLEWTSRHQLLMPLGAALIIFSILTSLRAVASDLLISVVIAGSLSFGIEAYYRFLVDWHKQLAIIEFAESSDIVRGASVIIVRDSAEELNAIARTYRFYEWNGLFERAYGDQKRFGINLQDVATYKSGQLDRFFSSHYKAHDHRRNESANAALIEITRQEGRGARLFPRIDISATSVVLSQIPGAP
jgi:hypothetical protein